MQIGLFVTEERASALDSACETGKRHDAPASTYTSSDWWGVFFEIRLGQRQSARVATSDVQDCIYHFAVFLVFEKVFRKKKVRAGDAEIDNAEGHSGSRHT